MSLIVDINPVPWEILEQVKARILSNRAKKQKRQPEKGKDLRRVMQVDNGILAKQRWEEPSFIGSERVFAIIFSSYIKFSFPGSKQVQVKQIPISYTVKVNGSTVGNVSLSGPPPKIERHIFIWASSDSDLNEIIALNPGLNLFGVTLEYINTVTVVETELPDPEGVTIIELSNITHENQVTPPVFTAAFYFDDEFTKKIVYTNNPNGSGSVSIEDKTLTYTLENWKPS